MWKSVKSGSGLFKALSRYLSGVNDENHAKPMIGLRPPDPNSVSSECEAGVLTIW
jgi:hypothetical protein